MGRQLIIPKGTDRSTMTIAPAVRLGDTLYVSGSAGVDRKRGGLAGEDIESQARQAMINLGEVLEAAGSSWDKVVKVNCYLVHASRDFDGWNTVFREFFPEDPPARTTVGTDIALEGALIEVDLIAAV
jgi:2-iminobutanoate/2-iminopropanoate deaminase